MISLPDADSSPVDRLSAYLQEITGALAAVSTERQVIEIVLTPAVKALGAVAGIVLLVDHTDQQIKIAGSQGYEDGARTVWQEGSVDDHVLIADILRMKQAMYFEHAGALRTTYPDLESRTGALAAVANAALPMFLDERPFGVIVLDFTEPHHFTADERRFLTILSGQCAIALGRVDATVTLEARVEERTQQLETANKELQASNDELEAFIYSASHDLRTPVRHVMSFAELAQKALEKTPNENVHRYLEVVKQGAQRINALIDGMLVLSRSGHQELNTGLVELNDLAAQARREVEQEFVGHPVHWQISDLPQVQGDRDLLQQVVTNLLSNAVKYSTTREQSDVEVWCEESASAWTICVRDNGVGFDPRYAQKLFGTFQRLHTEREFKGTGIGLATVRRIVLKHGGQVSAESPDDAGATFRVSLPRGG